MTEFEILMSRLEAIQWNSSKRDTKIKGKYKNLKWALSMSVRIDEDIQAVLILRANKEHVLTWGAESIEQTKHIVRWMSRKRCEIAAKTYTEGKTKTKEYKEIFNSI